MDAEQALELIDKLFKSYTENDFLVGMADAEYITAQGNKGTCYILCSEAMIIKVGDTLRILNENGIIEEDVSIKLLKNNGKK